ncbi:hypothetical protein BN903_59 [Halorubrum sp. AJ67]|nr:hypothetical protein BN903_59 [Halorubrum sp. AJ67]
MVIRRETRRVASRGSAGLADRPASRIPDLPLPNDLFGSAT